MVPMPELRKSWNDYKRLYRYAIVSVQPFYKKEPWTKNLIQSFQLVRLMRFERTTFRVGVWHSIQLSYRRIKSAQKFVFPNLAFQQFYWKTIFTLYLYIIIPNFIEKCKPLCYNYMRFLKIFWGENVARLPIRIVEPNWNESGSFYSLFYQETV